MGAALRATDGTVYEGDFTFTVPEAFELTEGTDLVTLRQDGASLTVVGPTQNHQAFAYDEALSWTAVSEGLDATPATPGVADAPAVADD